MLYIYALAADLGGIADLRGVCGEGLQLVPVGAGVAVAGSIDAMPAVDAGTLKAQDALVRVLHERAAALLPMRFGTAMIDATAAVEAINAREGIAEKLEKVRGCEQMIVRVAGEVSAAPAPDVTHASGRAYLEARARVHAATPELSAIARAAGPLARDVRIESAQQPGLMGSVYHLIARGRGDEYRAAIETAAAAHPGVRVRITGPFPAYAFA